MDPRFDHIRDWIFDLDNCLYPASTGLFALIDERMTAYIERLLDVGPEEARRVQKHHFHTHGTTLAGLIKEHEIDPHHFLEAKLSVSASYAARFNSAVRRLADSVTGDGIVHHHGSGFDPAGNSLTA